MQYPWRLASNTLATGDLPNLYHYSRRTQATTTNASPMPDILRSSIQFAL